MEIISILVGMIIGFVIGYIIFNLLNKSKSISKLEYDALNTKYNDANTQMKISEDRLSTQIQEFSKLNAKYEIKESENAELLSKSSSLETTVKNNDLKIAELSKSLFDTTAINTTQQDEINSLKQKISEEHATNNSLLETSKSQKETIKNQLDQISQFTEKINQLTSQNSTLTANNKSLSEKLLTQKEEVIELQKTAHLQFEKIANQILEDKSGKFTETNKNNIELLLKPLGENIENFKKKVEETYDKESKQRFSLEEKVKDLVEQTNKVSAEANNLATALKGQSKKQGNWGEMILESILQQSGLMKNREYFLQQTIKDEEGKSFRPDVTVHLPDNRIIIIDSKVSLVAYDRFSSAETTEEQAIHLLEHQKSIRNHIDDLHSKKYDDHASSLDFTMMFIPIEPAYLISIQTDQELWAYAYSKRILLISPTNLIACLKLMSDLWKREMQSKNAMEIVRRGELLYEKIVNFIVTLEDIGKHIKKTEQAYTQAISQINSGSGNLVGQAYKLKNLGLKSTKEIPANMLPTDIEDDTEIIKIEDNT